MDVNEILDFDPDTIDRAVVLLALARADGQPWEDVTTAPNRQLAEFMYGRQADAMMRLIDAIRDGVLKKQEKAWDEGADAAGPWVYSDNPYRIRP